MRLPVTTYSHIKKYQVQSFLSMSSWCFACKLLKKSINNKTKSLLVELMSGELSSFPTNVHTRDELSRSSPSSTLRHNRMEFNLRHPTQEKLIKCKRDCGMPVTLASHAMDRLFTSWSMLNSLPHSEPWVVSLMSVLHTDHLMPCDNM